MSKLTIFDLDNTLLAGDSDRAWGQYLVERRIVSDDFLVESESFYNNYYDGDLDIDRFLAFCLKPLMQNKLSKLLDLRKDFIKDKIIPMMLDKAIETVELKKSEGTVIIATATNSFVTRPIADLFKIKDLVATEFVIKDDEFTGEVEGIPCFREGKVKKVEEWVKKRGCDLSNATFYSDSFNDLPLLQKVETPIVVDGDEKLIKQAKENDWKCISFR
ncbi:MAG: HAD family hydrolase [Gammaproteobacteria bacterium]|jgi:HAD superfamily hydrolase (TIGR01490 family)|nr:HAD family hydrolase [Gammaproteobacteria bacterium]MBT4655408.1 HAD family hydrolase [Gammaproteobacteria bacterium]MBT5406533.1 HAD family hydrolase [Gammaproteobacteria bacterium]MBT5761598.1 HAD family hydrolase [Gammaproteobacteria bacterium]MBT7322605.1 HAD family hydrolase [Gammaproteobacteria bacterium]